MIYLLVFAEMFKVGLFSVGGGLATLPFLFELTTKYDWFTADELTNMIAVSESSPGPIGVNMATYLGFQTGGVLCGIASTLALVMPSIIVILIIARILEKFRDSIAVKNLFYGLRAAVSGLLTVSVLNVFMQTFFVAGAESLIYSIDFKKLALFAVLLFGVFKFKKHPLVYIATGAVCGAVFS
ncbi:MAG: chromate transporter, partial [Ruminococcaceae bacterium]|nr:chromate transporter [Oscillospiraceae bacterium]